MGRIIFVIQGTTVLQINSAIYGITYSHQFTLGCPKVALMLSHVLEVDPSLFVHISFFSYSTPSSLLLYCYEIRIVQESASVNKGSF